ncbi:MAG TPA: cytochrome c biogenesis protein CcdA [Candidatus Lustribacter sp.]
MIDPIALSVTAIVRGDATRLPIVALAGIATSLGPCVAPRYVAIAALLGEQRRTLTIATFVAGLLTAYAALGFSAGVLGQLAGHASALYCVLAAALTGAGIATLLRGPDCGHAHEARHGSRRRRTSAVFSLGAASALVVSPCCTPVVAAVLGMTALDGNPLSRMALLGAFALGHAAPLFVVGSLGSLGSRTFRTWSASSAPAVVSGTLMLALGVYYGLLV